MNWAELTMDTLGSLLWIIFFVVVIVVLFSCANKIARIMFFDFHFSEQKISDGEVINKTYHSGKFYKNGTKLSYTPEKHIVKIQTPQDFTELDHKHLFKKVKIGEKVVAHYQERYREPRFWHGLFQFDGYRLLQVVASKDKHVYFHRPMKDSSKLKDHLQSNSKI